MALVMSFRCNSILNPGSKFLLNIIGALVFITLLPASPPFIALNTVSGSNPAFVVKTNASDKAWMFAPTIIWFAYLVKFPAPISPQSTEEDPKISKIGLLLSKEEEFPPTMIANVPSIAPGSPPETGASINSTPFFSHSLAIFCDTSGEIELMSIIKLPLVEPLQETKIKIRDALE